MTKKLILSTIAIVFLLCGSVNAAEVPLNHVKGSIIKQSHELGVDPALALSIAKQESGFRHDLKSPYGAVGVYQLLPSTAKKLGVNPYYLNENIKGGLIYYKMMYKMFGSTELALAAYNAGPGNVKRYNNAVPPFRETKKFINNVMTEYNRLKENPDPMMLGTNIFEHGATEEKPDIALPEKNDAPTPINKEKAQI